MYLGIEIGGTKLQVGLGSGDGNLAAAWRGTIDPVKGAGGIQEQLLAAVPQLLAKAGVDRGAVTGVGIGFGGPVDDHTRSVIKSHQIKGWDGFPLADWIGATLGWPAVLGNDADVAGLAESLFGAGKGLSPVFYITVGSGIGGGLIINGEIYRGCGRGAAEIGHVQIMEWPVICNVEDAASGWAIAARGQAALRAGHGQTSRLHALVKGKAESLTTKQIAQAAREGDELANALLTEALRCLARGMTHVITLLCPRRFVIGGGVSLIGDELFFKPLRALVAEQAFLPFSNCFDIVPSALGEEVVVQGALALARQRLGGE